jgi:HK97 family phage major capsid protein/HK97 family phage prohead protease
MRHKAYSLLNVKEVQERSEDFLIKGIASTPASDRMNDIVEPLGARYKTPMPLLWFHKSDKPVGLVTFARPTSEGIPFEASIPNIKEPGTLKDRLDEAVQSIKHRLVAAVSIGFSEVEGKYERLKNGGIRFLEWDWHELSLVTIPANADATINSIKMYDDAALAVPGEEVKPVINPKPSPGAAGIYIRKAKPVNTTIREHIAAMEASRQAKAAKMEELMKVASDKGETLDEAGSQEFDGLTSDVATIDKDLSRYRELDKINRTKAAAVPAEAATEPKAAEQARTGVITVKSNLPKGTHFTRMCMAIGAGKGDYYRTIEHAKQWHDTPEVEVMVKAAVAAGTTTDATWAGPLVVAKPLVDEFLELLRPRTLLGRIPGLRQVPFNISVPSQTAGGTYGWVGQGAAKPVTSQAFATVTLTFAKAAGIVVLTEELVRFSSPSAEAVTRESMIAGIAQFLDQQFTDPAVAAVANVSPASITNGATTTASSGVTGAAARADLSAQIAAFAAADMPLEGSVWLMNDSNAFGLGLSLNALGQPLFPGVGQDGGTLMGRPVIVSNNVGLRIILVHAPSILFADDGGVSIDVSREASIQMDSAPETPSTASTVLVSLWQRNLIGLRAERFITWLRARTAAVRVITTAAPYNGT